MKLNLNPAFELAAKNMENLTVALPSLWHFMKRCSQGKNWKKQWLIRVLRDWPWMALVTLKSLLLVEIEMRTGAKTLNG